MGDSDAAASSGSPPLHALVRTLQDLQAAPGRLSSLQQLLAAYTLQGGLSLVLQFPSFGVL